MFKNYRFLLQDVFGIKSPAGAPLYHMENLFHCLAKEKESGADKRALDKIAEGYWNALLTKFPFLELKYGDILFDELSEKVHYHNGDIVFNKAMDRYELYYNDKAVVNCATIERVKVKAAKKYGITSFNILSVRNESTIESMT